MFCAVGELRALVEGFGPRRSRVVGTLVRVDRKGQRLFLGTQPGEPPVAVPNDEVKKAEVVMKPAAPGGAAAERPENRPEIHRMDIRQGTDSRSIISRPLCRLRKEAPWLKSRKLKVKWRRTRTRPA
jgi:hypothetical protein